MRTIALATGLGIFALACGSTDQSQQPLNNPSGGMTATEGGSANSGGSSSSNGGSSTSKGGSTSNANGGATSGSGGSGSGGKASGGAAATGGTKSGSGGTAQGSGGAAQNSGGTTSVAGTTSSAGAAGTYTTTPVDLCQGLVSDLQAHPMTALAKPAVGAVATDAEFGTKIRRITGVAASGGNPVIKPMYTTVSAWNADESKLILYKVGTGHQLYDGKTYALIRTLDISPPDLEQVFWHTSDPDVLFYVDGRDFVRYHVAASRKEVMTTFTFCSDDASSGSDPMFMSFDSTRIALGCGNQAFVYDISKNMVIARVTNSDENPPQMAPSGKFVFFGDSGRVADATTLSVVRTLDIAEPYGHACLGLLPTGQDTWNGVAFDPGPRGNDSIGSVVTFDFTTGSSKVVIGEDTGFPYPPTTHVSAMAYRNPGWVVSSTLGNTSGRGLLDLELTVANTSTGKFCRVGRHRSWGKENTQITDSYWAESHAVLSPTGTRIAFGSDWGNGGTVDTYVVELPSYKP
ncbi:MAG: hypothetical protein ACOY0T_17665 [Myxococcota bacterium]